MPEINVSQQDAGALIAMEKIRVDRDRHKYSHMRGQARRNARYPNILDMTSVRVRRFFLKSESYCSIELPPYFRFDRILSSVDKVLRDNRLSDLSNDPKKFENVNYRMLSNKDGRYAWRPFQLISPPIYIALVDLISREANWDLIKSRFKYFQNNPKIQCLSIPVESQTRRKDRAAQILIWWQGIEQASIELALDYNYVLHADITECYASIYTHSIAWALHGRDVAKKDRENKLLGNVIDRCIQGMQHGQTNGIPQGSVLMDFVAEMVLGYADLRLSERLTLAEITDYRILRYRDDYRIFVNNPQDGEMILKILTEVLIEMGLKLNSSKTTAAQSVVEGAVKLDKLTWMRGKQRDDDLQKYLFIIYMHGERHPNAGSLVVALTDFYDILHKSRSIRNPIQLISIATHIGCHNPRSFPKCAAIISKLLYELKTKNERIDILARIKAKLEQFPNTGHHEVWLQRISYSVNPKFSYGESLCRLAAGENIKLWNIEWISSIKLKEAIRPIQIVNRPKLKSLDRIVRPSEVKLFTY